MRAFYRPRTRPASHDLSQPPSIILIAGPTASGKSALALKMARATGAVIINADSQQLYADLRILTARPSAEDEALADHRLYGVADAAEAWSVGKWSRSVIDLLDAPQMRERQFILVGGTGLYFMALTKGLADIPSVPKIIRDSAEAEYLSQGESAFRARLAEIDLLAAQNIERGDRQRLIRAASVFAATGKSLSKWKSQTRPVLGDRQWKGHVVEIDRRRLYEQCDIRVEQMLLGGAIEEVDALIKRNIDPTLPVMKAVGVREIASYLNGSASLEAAKAALKQSTRNYAKRQLTWFRNQTQGWNIAFQSV